MWRSCTPWRALPTTLSHEAKPTHTFTCNSTSGLDGRPVLAPLNYPRGCRRVHIPSPSWDPSVIDNGPANYYKDLSIDQAQDAEFTRLRHSTSSTMNFKLLKSFDNQLIWCDVSTEHNRPYITAKFSRKVFSNLHGLGHSSHRATKPLINT